MAKWGKMRRGVKRGGEEERDGNGKDERELRENEREGNGEKGKVHSSSIHATCHLCTVHVIAAARQCCVRPAKCDFLLVYYSDLGSKWNRYRVITVKVSGTITVTDLLRFCNTINRSYRTTSALSVTLNDDICIFVCVASSPRYGHYHMSTPTANQSTVTTYACRAVTVHY